MVKTTMIRISQKSLNIDILNEIYSALEEESITIKRVFDPRFSFSGDDLIIEGDIDKVLAKLSQDLPRIISIRFLGDEYPNLFDTKSALNIQHENTQIFFGTSLVDYEHLCTRLRIEEKQKIFALLFRSQLGGQLISLMPVKIKGIVVQNKSNRTIDFILPTQRIETLQKWLDTLAVSSAMNFDGIVDIFRKTDPSMRKKMEDAMNWINSHLPEIVAKSSLVENVDIVRAYQNTLALI